MTQIILDEHLRRELVLEPLRRWTTASRIDEVGFGGVIKDDRIPEILRRLKRSTFITIDSGFWKKRWRDSRYCLIYFALTDAQQSQIPLLLRRLFRLPEFKTKAARMGKVARVSIGHIDYWQWSDERLHRLSWPKEL